MSLKGGMSDTELIELVDDAEKGKKKAINKLAIYVEAGILSREEYGTVISRRHKNKEKGKKIKRTKSKKKVIYTTFCIILALLLTSAAVVYHNYAIEKAFDKGYGYYKNVKNEYKFFNKYAVIVTTTGKKYHRYNCYHINGKELYIYNTANAEAKGYTACSDCISQTALEKLNKKYGLTQKVRKE